MLITHWSARIGLIICIALTLLFLLPSSPPEYLPDDAPSKVRQPPKTFWA